MITYVYIHMYTYVNTYVTMHLYIYTQIILFYTLRARDNTYVIMFTSIHTSSLDIPQTLPTSSQ